MGAGEKDGDRKVMDDNTRDLIAARVDPRKAEQIAREAMIKADRKLRDQGRR